MSTAFSQDFVQADRLIRRRYVQIPGKQKDLLDRADAWSENLASGSRGMINVPPEVVQDVKDFYARRHSKPTQQFPTNQPASPDVASILPRLSVRKSSPCSPRASQDDQAGNADTQIPWSSSPPCYPSGAGPVQSTEQPEPRSPCQTQSLPQPTASRKRKEQPLTCHAEPPASTAQSDAVPYEPLSALGQEPYPPVNRGANRVVAEQLVLSGATPPSAQVEFIPNTFKATEETVGPRPTAKKRCVEDIRFPDKEIGTTGQARAPSQAGPNAQSTAHHYGGKGPTNSVWTSSFPSQGSPEQLGRACLPETASTSGSNPQSSSSFAATYEGRPRQTLAKQKEVLVHAASAPFTAPAPAQRLADSSCLHPTERPNAVERKSTGNRTPYEEFKAAYPDYEESTRAFVRACLCVEKLERERALPEFLYDDFVRVYTTVYMDYYGEAQIRQYKEVLKATQWYNENVKEMVYNKKIIRKDNLPAILRAHDTAVRQIREAIRESFEARPITHDAESNDEREDKEIAVDGEQDQQEGSEPEDEPNEVSDSREPPELHIQSPGPDATGISGLVGNGNPKPVDEFRRLLPVSVARTRKYNERTEGEHTTSSTNDAVAPIQEFRSQSPVAISDEEAPQKGATPEIEATLEMETMLPVRDASAPREAGRNTSTPEISALTPGDRPRKVSAPLQLSSSSPTSPRIRGSDGEAIKDRTVTPLRQVRANERSPAFKSQAESSLDESSDDESIPFEPPWERTAMPQPRSAARELPAFLTQIQPVDDEAGSPDRLSEVHMPSPRQAVAQSRPAPQPSAVAGRKMSTVTPKDSEPGNAGQSPVVERVRVSPAITMGPSVLPGRSPASSNASRARVSLFKKRAGETKEERSRRFKEHVRNKLLGKTPSSTAASNKMR